ncbi:hypothetical protein FQA47_024372 [Oryzias melastigma]|uniref:Uncharacterized protein n=1 Tax=Oryzias melastigma TaxID=30732 RepID=A0A834BYE9_ORYME|nr:hypothetical protein FQA47_024372 [Oryzias melastigma]
MSKLCFLQTRCVVAGPEYTVQLRRCGTVWLRALQMLLIPGSSVSRSDIMTAGRNSGGKKEEVGENRNMRHKGSKAGSAHLQIKAKTPAELLCPLSDTSACSRGPNRTAA